MELCPVCFWEDAPGDHCWNGSNQVSLPVGQGNFAEFGACEPEYVDLVRAPHESEARPEDWTSFEDSRLWILDLIEKAFRDTKLDGGFTIHQREAIDDYASEEVFEAAAKKDPEVRWQDIPRSKIEKYGMSLVFFDPKGIRFHLPAFMRHSLQLWSESLHADFSHSDMLIYGLDDGPRSTGYYEHAFLLLNERQHQAVAAYLKFIALGNSYQNDAEKALANGWAAWLPDSFPFPSIP
jgi:hypothetical protein